MIRPKLKVALKILVAFMIGLTLGSYLTTQLSKANRSNNYLAAIFWLGVITLALWLTARILNRDIYRSKKLK